MDVAIVSPGLDRTVLDDEDVCIARTQVANRVHRRMMETLVDREPNKPIAQPQNHTGATQPPRAKEISFLLLSGDNP